MRSFTILGIVFVAYVLCSQTYGQTQETKEPFPYESWKYLYEPKCSKCHPLDRIFADPKTEEEWRSCITRMIEKSPLWITPEEGEQIITEILGTKKDVIESFTMKKKYADDSNALYRQVYSMSFCVNRILLANKTGEEWK